MHLGIALVRGQGVSEDKRFFQKALSTIGHVDPADTIQRPRLIGALVWLHEENGAMDEALSTTADAVDKSLISPAEYLSVAPTKPILCASTQQNELYIGNLEIE